MNGMIDSERLRFALNTYQRERRTLYLRSNSTRLSTKVAPRGDRSREI